MKYKDETEITELVKAFEDATIGRDVWKHAEHLVVALVYVNAHELETATAKMRDGLFNLLTAGFKVDLSKDMPYHETLTVFWMNAVSKFNGECNGLTLKEKANRLVEAFDKDYPLRFYSRNFLFSDEARSKYVEPDLA